MKHLKFIAALIQSANLGTIGVDLFVGTIPQDVPSGVMLRDPLAGIQVDEGMAGFYVAEIQVIVRDPDPEVSYARCQAISDAVRVRRVDNADITVSWVQPLTLPISYPRGDADDVETSMRVSIGFGLK